MSKWSRSVSVLAVVGAVSVAGCGGGGYPDNANDVCKDTASKTKKLTRPKAVGDLHVYFLKTQMILVDATKRLKGIKPPSDKATPYRAFLAGLDRELVVLNRATNTVAANPRRAVGLLQQQTSLSQEVNTQAKAAGLDQCAKSS